MNILAGDFTGFGALTGFTIAAEIERLRAALFEARERAEEGFQIGGANKRALPPSPYAKPVTIEVPEVVERQMPPYKRAIFREELARTARDPSFGVG